jgi:hypothetical protein
MWFGKFVLRTIVGLIVAIVLSGGQALGLIMVAVVCTAGLGLIVVVPAAYLIGLVCTIWFIPFGNKDHPTKKNIPRIPRDEVPYNRAALATFVSNSLKKGRDWESVRTTCLNSGWPEDILKETYDKVQAERSGDSY